MSPARVLLVDHKDSFAFILGEQFACRGAEVRTLRSDVALTRLQQLIADYRPHLVVLSPGPGHPESCGVTLPWLRTEPELPILGICLGHQALAVAAGGTVARAPRPVHGAACVVDFAADSLLAGLPRRFPAARYHSLVVTEVPATMEVLATSRDGDAELVMALRHCRLPQLGLQFHPESFLTPWGGRLCERVLASACDHDLSLAFRSSTTHSR